MPFNMLTTPHSVETAYSKLGGDAIEMYTVPSHKLERALIETAGLDNTDGLFNAKEGRELRASIDVADWLPFAAETYEISADLKDYVVVPVVLVPSDLPNRNLVAFPFRRLTEFRTETGTLGYRTWKGQPTHIEHLNKDIKKAKGVIFDVTLRRVKSAVDEMWKVVALCGFDRGKDPMLANDILTKKRTSYSMGAYVYGYTCSVCGKETSNPEQPPCMHIEANRRKMHAFLVKGQQRLAYYNTGPFRGFETSSVQNPGFVGATTEDILYGF